MIKSKNVKTVFGFVGSIIAFFAMCFVLRLFGVFSFGFFAPKEEAIRYKTFKESQSYNEGMIRDLENLKMEYIDGDAPHKVLLRSIIIQRFAAYQGQLPPDLQNFYYSLINNQQ